MNRNCGIIHTFSLSRFYVTMRNTHKIIDAFILDIFAVKTIQSPYEIFERSETFNFFGN